MAELRVGSLFSGIGGFDLGLERAGMRTAWFCEQDAFCRRVLAKHWPDVPCYGDVCGLTGASVSPIDVLCGGFPCQDISLAGKGAGIEGARSGLWSEYARLIGELRPRYVIVENVSALLGRGLDRVLGDLSALGFDAEWDCLPASAFGAPHRRDRVWIVAYAQREPGNVRWSSQKRGRADETEQAGLGGSGVPAHPYADRGRLEVRSELDSEAEQATADRHSSGGHPGLRDEVADPASVYVRDGYTSPHPFAEGGKAWTLPVRRSQRSGAIGGEHWWSVEPDVGRVANGVPARVDRLRSLGNALVPQIAEWIGRRIAEYERCLSTSER